MIVEQFNVLGLKAEILRMEELGHLCGYVEIPKGHVYYDKEYDANGDWVTISENDSNRTQIKYPRIEVHGGVTYSGKMQDGKTFCWGFDCAHYGDNPVKCDIPFVRDEIRKMAKRILYIESLYATGRK